VAVHVLDLARGHLMPEPLAAGPRQRVTSLYLDTPDLQFLRWHHERAEDRFKLRIRRYGEPPVGGFYSEIKRKTHAVVRKQRSAFEIEQLPAVIERWRQTSSAEPRVLVTGIRESLRDPGSEDAVTVDRDLRYQPMPAVDLIGEESAWRALPLPRKTEAASAVLELKYGERAPSWMQPLLEALEPSQVALSKYAAAMSAAFLDHQAGART
jgi:hypothetical protein